MMRVIALLVTLAAFLAGCGQPQAVREEKAVSAIIKLGGTVTRDEKLPGRPVVGVKLGNYRVTDPDLKILKEFEGLQTLDLANSRITDVGLKELKGLKGLKWLGLNGTRITDAGLKELKELKGLEMLRLDHTQITDAGLKDLKQALPEASIYGPLNTQHGPDR